MKRLIASHCGIFICIMIFVLPGKAQQPSSTPNSYKPVLDRLQAMTGKPLVHWKFHAADLPHPEDPSLDDSSWRTVAIQRGASTGPGWYRRWIEIPEKAGGYGVQGARLRVELRGGPEVRVFVNGSNVGQGDLSVVGPILISGSAQPGQKLLLAVEFGLGREVARFRSARLVIDRPGVTADPAIIRDEILVAQAMLAGFPDAKRQYGGVLDDAVKSIDFAALDRGDSSAFSQSLETAQNKMQPLGQWMKQYTVRAVGNAHIDMAWLWPWTETVEVVRNTYGTVLQLMNEYPQFRYAQSSARTYDWLEEKYPHMFEQIKQRVKDGRWEIVGGMWVEPDLNMPDGESLVRQLLVGQRYFRQNFNVVARIGWNPDSFGYNWQLPQILKRSGLDYFVTQKMSWNDTTVFPYKLFWWQSPDGSRVLTYFPHDYVNTMEPVRIAKDVATYVPQTGVPEIMHLYGIGDHGGGPTRSMLDEALRWQNPKAIFPHLVFSSAQDFFDDVEKSPAYANLPVWNNELYLEYHRGVFTTQSETKRRMRASEEMMQNAEKFSSVAMLYGRPYPQQHFERDWQKVLFDQFHDIMPGSGIAVNYVDAARALRHVRLDAGRALQGSLTELAAHVNTGGAGVPVLVFNPLSFAQSGPVKLSVQMPQPFKAIEVRDAAGKVVAAQILHRDDETHRVKLMVVAASVPPLGYAVFHAQPVDAAPEVHTPLKAAGATLENEFVRVTVDPQTGCITSLVNKGDGRDALAQGACGNLLQAFHDMPKEYDAWNIDADFEKQHWDINRAEDVKLVENGPVRAVLHVRRKFQSSTFDQDITLYAGVPRVDIRTTADWHERHTLLKAAFPVSVESKFATYEIPYGAIERPTTRNTPAEKAKFEVGALRWADLSDSSHGFSLLNASKYGYDAKGNVLRLSLLRSPTSPDPQTDQGVHHFTYSLYPHAHGWEAGGVMQQGYELNFPLIAVTTAAHLGALPAAHSFASIQPANLILTAMKKAEDDNALILRFYEFAGQKADARITLPGTATRAAETNLMEKEEGPLSLQEEGRQVTVPVNPYEIKTIKVWMETEK